MDKSEKKREVFPCRPRLAWGSAKRGQEFLCLLRLRGGVQWGPVQRDRRCAQRHRKGSAKKSGTRGLGAAVRMRSGRETECVTSPVGGVPSVDDLHPTDKSNCSDYASVDTMLSTTQFTYVANNAVVFGCARSSSLTEFAYQVSASKL